MNTYEKFKSIVTVRKKEELDEKLQKLIDENIDFTHDHVLLSKDEVFDNKIIDRYISLFNKLIEQQGNN
ncbi:hypothetical protein [Halarcobacter anaerophilus]|uniref:hypothetical protein n=1 Tax=Halarcobacter anaerophilus TaxID=877500 RepID=UPI0005CAC8E0|nr:hypothetical protein [Halarcobacter anaerophilus]